VVEDGHSRRHQNRRLQLVGNEQDPDTAAAPDGELTATQAAVFAALVAEAKQSAVDRALDQMSAEQLRSLAIALATQVNAAENATGEVADVGPNGICAIAVATAAQSFGTTRDAVLSADRHRAVTDARAVAMTAARRGGITLPAIATFFGKDHTTVMNAQNKVANNPRLKAVCTRIVDQLEEHYAKPTSNPAYDAGDDGAPNQRSETLQLAALDQARNNAARRHDEDTQRLAVSAVPSP
jgi:hypothetical protein